MSNSIVSLQYNDQISVNFTSDAWFNATTVAKQYNKRPNDWLSLESTKEYIKCLHAALFPEIALPEKMVTKQNQLVKTKTGGLADQQGSWFHPKLAIAFARWLDVKFSIWCDMQIEKLLHPKLATPQTPSGLPELLSANLTPLKKIMMLTLASQADENGQVQIGIHDLANICGIAKSTTCESVNGLEKSGFLTITKTYGVAGGSQPNIYTIPERFRMVSGEVVTQQRDWINQPKQTELPVTSIPKNMVLVSSEDFIDMKKMALPLQLADLKFFVEQSGGLVLMKDEVDKMKGILKA